MIPMVVAMYMEARAIERQYLHAAIYVIGIAVGFCLESDSFCVVTDLISCLPSKNE